jgi:putative Mg2+ transporter-C (MgtC) family protein
LDVSAGDQIEIVLRLALAGVLGAIVGLERDLRDYPAGLRTMALVTLGSCLFMEVSLLVGAQDRIAAQVVTGIGFLGAGVIFREGLDVKGVTTAATIWAMAAIGLAVGAELYVAAPLGTFLVLVVLELRAFTKSEAFEGRIRQWLERVAPPIKDDIEDAKEEVAEGKARAEDKPQDDQTNYKPPWNQEQ